MKLRKRTSIVCIFLTVIVLLVSACSKNSMESNGTEAASAPEKAQTSTTKDNVVNKEPLSKYDPPIEVTAYRSMGQEIKFKDGESIENNVWSKAYEEELGIKIKYPWIVVGPEDQYNQKLTLSFASSQLADIMEVNAQQVKQLADAGQLEDLTSVLADYSSDLTKDILNQDGGIALKSATFNGKLLALPWTSSDIGNAPMLFVRMDWLKKLNLPEPKNMNDVFTIAEAFAKRDPDGNNKDDTFGFGLDQDLGGYPALEGFYDGFHAYPSGPWQKFGFWIKDASGKLVNGSIQPEVKNALAKLQEMYKAGIIDPEFGSKDFGKFVEQVASGKLGMFYGVHWTPLSGLQDLKMKEKDMEWKAFPVLSIDDQPALASTDFSVAKYFVVRKGAAHPEAIVKLLNLALEKSYGASADPDKYMTKDGIEFHKYILVRAEPANRNLDVYKHIVDALNKNDPSKLDNDEKANYDQITKFRGGDLSGWAINRIFGPGGSQGVIQQYSDNKQTMHNAFFGAPTASMGDKLPALQKMQNVLFTKIIMGVAPLDDFDKFVTDWGKLGGDQLTKEVNDWYATQQ